jgi:hypothetical protein
VILRRSGSTVLMMTGWRPSASTTDWLALASLSVAGALAPWLAGGPVGAAATGAAGAAASRSAAEWAVQPVTANAAANTKAAVILTGRMATPPRRMFLSVQAISMASSDYGAATTKHRGHGETGSTRSRPSIGTSTQMSPWPCAEPLESAVSGDPASAVRRRSVDARTGVYASALGSRSGVTSTSPASERNTSLKLGRISRHGRGRGSAPFRPAGHHRPGSWPGGPLGSAPTAPRR